MVKQFESMCTAAVELTSIAVTGTLNRTGLICFGGEFGWDPTLAVLHCDINSYQAFPNRPSPSNRFWCFASTKCSSRPHRFDAKTWAWKLMVVVQVDT